MHPDTVIDGAARSGAGRDAAQAAVLGLDVAQSAVVVGGAGTGKTTTLIARVAQQLAAGVDPADVLVLTPSRQSATDLRDRLAVAAAEAAPGITTPGALARSVSSFAFHIVRAATVHAGGEPPQLLTGADQDQIVADLLEGDGADAAHGRDRWPAWLGTGIRSTKAFRSEVRAFMAECEALGITPTALETLAGDREVWRSMASFLREYLDVRDTMRSAHRDPATLVREASGLLRRATDAALGPLAALKAVLVDDAQELTLGGIDLLVALRDRGVAVLAFGDPDVGSGAFRGASPEHMARLAAALGETLVLRTAHRGTAAQADLARRVTQRIGAAGVVAHRVPPASPPVEDETVRAIVTRSASEEYDTIARLLRERHVHDGVPWHDCAVIAHDTRQVAAIEAELAAREVPTRAAGPGRALGARGPVRELLHLVLLAERDPLTWTNAEVDQALGGTFGRLDPVALRRLRGVLRQQELAGGGDRSARDLLRSGLAAPLEFDLVDTREARRAARFAKTLAAVRDDRTRGATIHELLWRVWDGSGLARTWSAAAAGTGPLADQANRDLDALVALFEAAKRFVEREPDEDGTVFVRRLLDSDVADDTLTAPPPRSAVRVMTPAAALGTAFDTVIVAGVQEGVWPNVRLRGGLLETWRLAEIAEGFEGADVLDRRRAVMHDELRLFVRAITRARARLVVTAVDDDDTGPSVLFELLPQPEPGLREAAHPLSLRGLVALHRRALTDPRAPGRLRRAAPGQLALLADAGIAGAHPAQWYGVAESSSDAPLRDIREEVVRVSPSRLQALEQCELDWVIADLGGNTRSGATAGLGTLVHAAMENTDAADEEALWAVVDGRWGELEFDAAWIERQMRTRARDLVRRLNLYLRDFERSGGGLIGAEPHFEIPLDLEGGAGIVVSGYIDRVERTREGTVVIVDLKTGKNEPTTSAKVADHPQLAAYQLAFESGRLADTDGLAPGGAKLLVLTSVRGAEYATPHQPPFDDETRAAFLARVRRAAQTMAGTAFTAPYEEHCRDDYSYGLCRIHTVRAVSAS